MSLFIITGFLKFQCAGFPREFPVSGELSLLFLLDSVFTGILGIDSAITMVTAELHFSHFSSPAFKPKIK